MIFGIYKRWQNNKSGLNTGRDLKRSQWNQQKHFRKDKIQQRN